MSKMTICIDFDGVIHDYMNGWKDGEIYGNVVLGFFEWAAVAKEHFNLVVYSSRSKTPEGIAAMREWMQKQMRAWYEADSEREQIKPWPIILADFSFSDVKPAAFLTIDDRAICFGGDWSDPGLSVEQIKAFRPWNKP